MLVDLRTKFPDLTGKVAERALVGADITGIRLGTPAITTRGVKEDQMETIVELIDTVLSDPENPEVIASVRNRVNAMMANYPIFAY